MSVTGKGLMIWISTGVLFTCFMVLGSFYSFPGQPTIKWSWSFTFFVIGWYAIWIHFLLHIWRNHKNRFSRGGDSL
jgi:hypothetical protein